MDEDQNHQKPPISEDVIRTILYEFISQNSNIVVKVVRKSKNRKFENRFNGSTLLDWLLASKNFTNNEEALDFCQHILSLSFIESINDKGLKFKTKLPYRVTTLSDDFNPPAHEDLSNSAESPSKHLSDSKKKASLDKSTKPVPSLAPLPAKQENPSLVLPDDADYERESRSPPRSPKFTPRKSRRRSPAESPRKKDEDSLEDSKEKALLKAEVLSQTSPRRSKKKEIAMLSPRSGIFAARKSRKETPLPKRVDEIIEKCAPILRITYSAQEDIISSVIWHGNTVLRSVVTKFCTTRDIPLDSIIVTSADKELDLDKTLEQLDIHDITIEDKINFLKRRNEALLTGSVNVKPKTSQKDQVAPLQKQQIFGACLSDIACGKSIPPFIYSAMNRLITESVENPAFQVGEIFRDVYPPLDQHKHNIENGKLKMEEIIDMQVVAGLIVAFFEATPETIFGHFSRDILYTSRIENADWICNIWHSIIWRLIPLHRHVLRFLIRGVAKLTYDDDVRLQICSRLGYAIFPSPSPKLLPPPPSEHSDSGALLPSLNSSSLGPRKISYDVRQLIISEPGKLQKEGTVELFEENTAGTALFKILKFENRLFDVEFPHIKYYDKDGRICVSCATIELLVEKLTDEYYAETEYPHIFWTFIDYFTTPNEVYLKLSEYLSQLKDGFTWQRQKRMKILDVVKIGLRITPPAIIHAEHYRRALFNFLQYCTSYELDKLQISERALRTYSRSEGEDKFTALRAELESEIELDERSGRSARKSLSMARNFKSEPDHYPLVLERTSPSPHQVSILDVSRNSELPKSRNDSPRSPEPKSRNDSGSENEKRKSRISNEHSPRISRILPPQEPDSDCLVVVKKDGSRKSQKKYLSSDQAKSFEQMMQEKSDLFLKEFTEQFAIVHQMYFCKLTREEVLHRKWMDPVSGVNFQSMIDYFNLFSLWVQEWLLKPVDMEERKKTWFFFITVAYNSIKCGNINGAMSIYTAFFSECISRLRDTIEFPKKIQKKWTVLTELFSWEKNYVNYREKLRNIQPPVVPCLGILTKDLFAIEESNVTVVSFGHDDLVNFHKFRLLYGHIIEIEKFQLIKYEYPRNEALQIYLSSIVPLDKQVLYEMSLKLKPKAPLHSSQIKEVL